MASIVGQSRAVFQRVFLSILEDDPMDLPVCSCPLCETLLFIFVLDIPLSFSLSFSSPTPQIIPLIDFSIKTFMAAVEDDIHAIFLSGSSDIPDDYTDELFTTLVPAVDALSDLLHNSRDNATFGSAFLVCTYVYSFYIYIY